MTAEKDKFVTVLSKTLDLPTVFGTTYQQTTFLREGQTVQLVRPGANTPNSWMVREGDFQYPYSVNLLFFREATEKEISTYYSILRYVDSNC